MDVKSAFLYGTIKDEVYVCQPPSFEDPQFSNKVYKVEKALYGLHQAHRAWYETLSTYLLENGFRRGTIDKTLFIKKNKGDIFEDSKHSKETNKALLKDEEDEDVDVHLYRSMIGSLLYLIASRPDIMFADYACARDSPFDLEAFSDSDYAGASLDMFLAKDLLTKAFDVSSIRDKFGNKTGSCKVNTARHVLVLLSIISTLGYILKTVGSNAKHIEYMVGDEAVHKELGNRMERVATTASSLEAGHDSGNINRTQSMATLNELSPKGTSLGSGPRIGVDTAMHKLNTSNIKLVLPDIS
ncbi:retrovirus-related pol polyprotein from transposon TNT 1-94 [Tanacetum coccineum]